jgi:hypothetical protein
VGYRKLAMPAGGPLAKVANLAKEAAAAAPVMDGPLAKVANLAKPAASIPPLNPRITRQPPFGSDRMPAQYAQAWQAMLDQCPPGVKPFQWEAAIFDAAALFGDWGALLVEYGWAPNDLFAVPHHDRQGGLAWFIKGSPVVALGRQMAQTQDGRIYRR